MTRRGTQIVLGLVAAGALVAACGGSGDDGTSSGDATASTAPAPVATEASTTAAPDTAAPEMGAPDTAAPDTAAPATDPPATDPPVTTTTYVVDRPPADGAVRLHYEVGPIDVRPGQNNIDYEWAQVPKPDVNGWITRIQPDLRLADGSIPPVDVIHLHHGVWLNRSRQDATRPGLPERFFAAGEEKTIMTLPPGYGYAFDKDDNWVLNYMVHNLWPDPQDVWITYDIDFIPANSPAAEGIVAARPVWTDVQNGSVYPVFDVLKGDGRDGRYTYPDQAVDPYGPATEGDAVNEWTVDRDGYLLGTAGHLHPGGLHTDLWLQRDGATAPEGAAKRGAADTARLFQSEAVYYEPAGAVSWDVAMTATPTSWRPEVRAGDVLSTNATYDSSGASWYESMGIMVVWMADELAPGDTSVDPFETRVDAAGEVTHGHLAENDNHGGEPDPQYTDLRDAPSTPADATVQIADFVYGQGDMLLGTGVPTVQPGGTITFDNLDAPLENGIWHTITACTAPCTGATGVAYPLADSDVIFDSGQLGVAGPPTAGRVTWTTPADLAPGTYTYFCRVHPFMRGAFRVQQ